MFVERGCRSADERLGELEKVEFHDAKEKTAKDQCRQIPLSQSVRLRIITAYRDTSRELHLLRRLPTHYLHHLAGRDQALLAPPGTQQLTMRAFWVGSFLSFFLAVGAPYGNMIIRGSYMALDFSTPGAIFLFLVLIGLLNVLFKVAASPLGAAVWALVSCALYSFYYGWVAPLDPFAPGFFFATFILASSLLNMVLVSFGRSLVLNRAELILVYVMLLIVSALCTMGLSEQILPMITAIFYFASPENKWQEELFPHFSAREVLVNDGSDSKTFYEGLAPGEAIPYAAWVRAFVLVGGLSLGAIRDHGVGCGYRPPAVDGARAAALSDHAGGAGDGARRGARA